MKKIIALGLGVFTISSSLSLAAPQQEDKFDISLQEWKMDGSFDYYLHNSDASRLLSEVNMPQKQNMTILDLKYNLDGKKYIKLQYGMTSTGNKGRGSDSDWTNVSSNAKTDYGTMNFNGKQKLTAIDFGTLISKTDRNKTNAFIGWEKRDTDNELTNVVYHLIDEADVGNVAQPDNGSRLNGTFNGLHIGIENEYKCDNKLSIVNGLTLSCLNAKAYGHWANHSPAWDWEDSGYAFGYNFNVGLKYAFDKNVKLDLGYYYSHTKLTDGNESLNYNDGQVNKFSGIDLRYKQKGYYFGLNCKF